MIIGENSDPALLSREIPSDLLKIMRLKDNAFCRCFRLSSQILL